MCVDLDGTLIKTDLLLESLVRAIRRNPAILLWLPLWWWQGRQKLKAEVARRGVPDFGWLPYNRQVVALVEQARVSGRETVLVTGSNVLLAQQVSDHLGLFDRVLASDELVNLTGKRKAKLLQERYGATGFIYAGNERVDIPVWQAAAEIITVNAPRGVAQRAQAMGKPTEHLQDPKPGVKPWLKAVRLHQWAKNLLLFVPLITAHLAMDPGAWLAAIMAFVAFGLTASATYIVNDLLDLDADRQHRTKRKRPFASGVLSIRAGVVASALLLAAGLGVSAFLPGGFVVAMLVYLASTLLYSLKLKRVASLDILVLATLYTLRIIAGALAIGVPVSFWLLAFSMFIFLCLALVKRVAELVELSQREASAQQAEPLQIRGREYDTRDLPLLQTLGACSGYLSVLVLALYIHSPEVALLYRSPELLWFIAPLMLLWVTRIWVVTSRGYMHDDPIVFAIKDPETWVTAAITVVILMLATWLQLDLGLV